MVKKVSDALHKNLNKETPVIKPCIEGMTAEVSDLYSQLVNKKWKEQAQH